MFKKKQNRLNSGVTMIELMVVVAFIALMAFIVLFANFNKNLQKTRDSKRKQDISQLTRVLEEYFNDKQLYPNPHNPKDGSLADAKWGQSFPSYNFVLPKDPLSPRQDYYYESDLVKPSFFIVYTRLENTDDKDPITLGCQYGCGPNRAFNYYVSSSNIKIKDLGMPDSGQLGTYPTKPVDPVTIGSDSCYIDRCSPCKKCGGISTSENCYTRQRCRFDGSSWYCGFAEVCP